MESQQLPRTHGHHYESTDLSASPSAQHSGEEGHHEKPSVLKKVKAKAKKIKDTLTKHGHDHNHSQDEYEEDDEEEMVEDPEIHGAPIYESEAVRDATRASSGHPTTGGTNFDRPSMIVDPHYDSTKPISAGGTNLDRPSMVGDPHYDSAKPTAGRTNLDRPSMANPHYDSPIVDPETRPFAQWQVDEGHGKHLLKEHKHAPVPCKLVDTRSGEDVYPELPHKGINTRTGRNVREERKNPDQLGDSDAMEGIRRGIGTTGFEVDPQGPNIRAHPFNVQVKTIDPAGRGSEEAEGITPVIKSFNKMGISEEKPNTEQEEGLYSGSHDQFAPEPMPRGSSDSVPKSNNASNPKDTPGDIYNPAGNNPRDIPGDIYNPAGNSSTYTEKITSASAAAASAIAGTAQSAKNVIASKIEQMREPGEGNKTGSVAGTASDYAHRVAATVTDTLAPVYGKVVGAGSGASTKASGLGAETTQEKGGNVGQDKGVSVKEYWVEKLKPGEEDKALSSMITESFGKPKGEKMDEVPSGGGGERSISQIVSDAIHKREPEESEERKPMGKVTESGEVAKRLGTGEEGSGLENIGTGAGVVNKLTGAIGSWFGGHGGRAQSTPGTTLADNNEGEMGKNA
ncbi:low-temperature-induced 65 kDa protein-like [Apium graveolens]|uniref:low-temperature-induced 65 kDa protein-like n=1 Tax=Apium graveolens TaxID=4045 RepID=UPI003D7B79A4